MKSGRGENPLPDCFFLLYTPAKGATRGYFGLLSGSPHLKDDAQQVDRKARPDTDPV